MSVGTPLAVLVGGGRTRYVTDAADRAHAWIRGPEYQSESRILHMFNEPAERLLAGAVLRSTKVRTYEEIAEIVAILTERGVVP